MPMPDQDPAPTGEPGVIEMLRAAGEVDPNRLDFPPVRNGVDYLVSVVDHLTAEGDRHPRDLKYAVLHLQAAAEVLLKARLVREHWSLVFMDPGKATRQKFDTSTLKSCGVPAAAERLRNIAGVDVTTGDAKVLEDLAQDRNALQHFGLTRDATAVEARAGLVLDFLVRFLDDVLLPGLSREEVAAIASDMNRIREGLNAIHAFVTERMLRLKHELAGDEDRTVACPTCGQLAMVADGSSNRCHFCNTDESNMVLMAGFLVQSLNDPGLRVRACPQCQKETLVDGARLASEPGPVSFCFGCATRIPDTAPGEPR
ncbi:hypothetical protein [Streptomyces europaeiscabiei]|uniref:hypothetical protein n=1 Tax=Streptomyces europaeiscabiei TaxID=146819 RepID=UPI002E2BE653|nr:hypothetical protein [Streptomyces europaeiscabiei]